MLDTGYLVYYNIKLKQNSLKQITKISIPSLSTFKSHLKTMLFSLPPIVQCTQHGLLPGRACDSLETLDAI